MKPRHLVRSLLFFTLVLICNFANAEILHGVFPLDTLKAIKAKYPNARFDRVNAAWVTENEAFFQMTGSGFPGTLYVAFTDSRPTAKKYLLEKCMFPAQTTDAICAVRKKTSEENDDDALTTSWVRWVPPSPIPLDRYKSKYGEPTFEFAKDSMAPTAEWKSVELSARLSDDKKMVLTIETAFTRAELRAAWIRDFGFVPDFLKDEPAPKQTPRPAARKVP